MDKLGEALIYLGMLTSLVTIGCASKSAPISDYYEDPSPKEKHAYEEVSDTVVNTSVIKPVLEVPKPKYPDKVKIDFGIHTDILGERGSMTYTISGKDYKVTALYVEDPKAVFKINDELSDTIGEGEYYELLDGKEKIGVIEFWAKETGEGYLNFLNFTDIFYKKNTLIVVGEDAPAKTALAASDIATKIYHPVEPGAVIFDTKLEGLTGNTILVGTPCDNRWIAKVKGVEYGSEDCTPGIEEGKARVELKNYYGNRIAIVTGGTPKDIREAAMLVANFDQHNKNFDGTELEIQVKNLK